MADATIHQLWQRLNANVKQAQRKLGIEEPVEAVSPPSEEFGHLGFPAFSFARQLRRAPQQIAEEIAANFEPDELIDRVETLKGYVNIFLNQEALASNLLGLIYEQQDAFGGAGVVGAQKWVLEYSSPNTNKPLHLGHIRNNLLGLGISNIASYFGHDVVRVNLINDRGIHICKTMLSYRLWGEGATPESSGVKGDHLVGESYVRFDREFKHEYETWKKGESEPLTEDGFFNSEHSKLGMQARELLTKWEAGDPETISLWKTMNEWVYAGFRTTYDRMGCVFDQMQYESQTYKLGKAMVQEGLDRGLFETREDGAVVLNLEKVGKEGEKVLLRSDGTSVYMTQDIGTAAQRLDQHKPNSLVYIVGDEQIYHFQVLFDILGLLRDDVDRQFYHLAYGMVRLPDGKMKSREGKVVDADDLMDELHALARTELQAREAGGRAHVENLSEEELQNRSEGIAQAALKFFVFKFTPRKSFEYDPKKSIDFTGQTGPYCLYAYARTRSLIRKCGWEAKFDASLVKHLTHPVEGDVLRQLLAYPQVVARAAEGYDPSKIADYAYNLASGFARLFTDKTGYPILSCEDESVRNARVMLAGAVGIAIRSALGLLGIDVLEEM
jgi:arginyl-tRNA synthetase